MTTIQCKDIEQATRTQHAGVVTFDHQNHSIERRASEKLPIQNQSESTSKTGGLRSKLAANRLLHTKCSREKSSASGTKPL